MARINAYLDSESSFAPEADPTAIRLSPRESHHLATVLRVRAGDAVTALDGRGSIYNTVAANSDRREIELRVEETTRLPRPRPEIILLPAILKSRGMESLLRGCAEVGVSRIIPLCTDHVEGGNRQLKNKWHQVLQESLKQCGNPWLPELESPLSLESALHRLQPLGSHGCVAALEAPEASLWEHLARIRDHPPESYYLLTGPEGDFSPREYALLREAGVPAVSLGSNILRAETAAIVAAGMAIAALRQGTVPEQGLLFISP